MRSLGVAAAALVALLVLALVLSARRESNSHRAGAEGAGRVATEEGSESESSVAAGHESVESGPAVIHVIDRSGVPVRGARIDELETLADGTCELDALEGEPVRVSVLHPDYAPGEIEIKGQGTYWVRLRKGKDVIGRVVDQESGEPMPGARAVLKLPFAPVGVSSQQETTADAGGRVRWKHVPEGWVSVEPRRPQFGGQALAFQVTEGREPDPFLLRVEQRRRTVVRLVDEAGEPVDRAHVFGVASARQVEEVTEGKISVWWSGPVTTIEAFGPEWEYGALRLVNDGRLERTEDLVLRKVEDLEDTGELQFKVWDRTSETGIAGAEVDLEFRSPALRWQIAAHQIVGELTTDEEGLIRVVGLPAGSLFVRAGREGYDSEDVGLTLRPGEVLQEDLGLLRAAPAIEGHCEPAGPVEVWRNDPGWGARTDSKGLFWFRRLYPREEETLYTIRFKRPGAFHTTHVVEGVRSGTRDLVLRFPPAGDLVVRCRDVQGRAVTDIRAVLELEGQGLGPEWMHDARGDFAFNDVVAGRARVWLRRPGCGGAIRAMAATAECARGRQRGRTCALVRSQAARTGAAVLAIAEKRAV